jgi:catechol 2,3-dioxygenase-like lactoylglutathione lyase family enzyme
MRLGTHRARSGYAPEHRAKGADMLENGDVAARIPAKDLERARAFYADKLGLTPTEERPGGLRYRCGNGWFSLFQSAGAASGAHTQMAWEVESLRATVDGIAEVAGNYPSSGVGERAAWFRDSEGNLLGIGEPIR